MDSCESETTLSVRTLDLLSTLATVDDSERSRIEEAIVRSHLPMAHRLVGRFRAYGADPEDLLQVANIAVVKAIRRFDSERGQFEPFAQATITGELKKYLRDYCWSIKPPRRIQELQSQIARAAQDMSQSRGQEPTQVEIAEATHASMADVSEALSAKTCYAPSSLDSPIGVSGVPMSDSIPDDDEPYDRVDSSLTVEQLCADIRDDDVELIRLRFHEGLSQREIAMQLGISQMQVSRRLTRLLDELRDKAALCGLR